MKATPLSNANGISQYSVKILGLTEIFTVVLNRPGRKARYTVVVI